MEFRFCDFVKHVKGDKYLPFNLWVYGLLNITFVIFLWEYMNLSYMYILLYWSHFTIPLGVGFYLLYFLSKLDRKIREEVNFTNAVRVMNILIILTIITLMLFKEYI